MAALLQRRCLSATRRILSRSPHLSLTERSLSSDSLVEVKPGEIGIVSGIPEDHLRRKVMIYSPARAATQQGSGKIGKWKINFLSTQKWDNPLMGWTSTGDPYANVGDAALGFDSEEGAKEFAQRHGWDYVVKRRHTPLLKAHFQRTYAHLHERLSLPPIWMQDSILVGPGCKRFGITYQAQEAMGVRNAQIAISSELHSSYGVHPKKWRG